MTLQTANWNTFRTFYYAAKAVNFSQAAETLQMSQSAVSRSIAALEAILEKRLFHRNCRGVVLTPEGKELLKTVEVFFNLLANYGEKVQESLQSPEGVLKILMAPDVPRLRIAQHTSHFFKLFPGITLAFLDPNQPAPAGVNPNQADAAIQPFDPHAKNKQQIFLTTVSLGLYASAPYLEAYGAPHSEEDLDNHLLVALGYPDPLPPSYRVNKILDRGVRKGKWRKPTLCVSSLAEMAQAVQAGLGLALLPTESAEASPGLVRILPETVSVFFDLSYTYPLYHRRTNRIIAYGDFLVQKFKKR